MKPTSSMIALILAGTLAGTMAAPAFALPMTQAGVSGRSHVVTVRDRCGAHEQRGARGTCRPAATVRKPAAKAHQTSKHAPAQSSQTKKPRPPVGN